MRGDRENVQVLAMRNEKWENVLDRTGVLDYHNKFVIVLLQSLLGHRNLVNLIGYFADSNQLSLLYDCDPSALLKDRLHGKLLNLLSKLRNIRLVRKVLECFRRCLTCEVER
jgi:hypothetical protein